MNAKADDPSMGRVNATPATGGRLAEGEDPGRESLPDHPWMTGFTTGDAPSGLLTEGGEFPPADLEDAGLYVPASVPDLSELVVDPVSGSVSDDAAAACACPPVPFKGYLLAALVGALSLAVIVAGLMVGWNFGQRRDDPVLRPGGSPGLPVAQPRQEGEPVAVPAPSGLPLGRESAAWQPASSESSVVTGDEATSSLARASPSGTAR